MDPLLKRLTAKYADKLMGQGSAPRLAAEAIAAGLDAELVWSAEHEAVPVLSRLFDLLSINSLVFARPAEPYATMLTYLARQAGPGGAIRPEDCETRTFLHDLPVVAGRDPEGLAKALTRRKGAVILEDEGEGGGGVSLLAHGSVSPEQGFVTISSLCFSGFVLFCTSHLRALRAGTADASFRDAFAKAMDLLPPVIEAPPPMQAGPLTGEAMVPAAMDQAGKAVVGLGLVDSYFGNISCLDNGILYISETGSSLDELPGCIAPVPLDGLSTAGLTASSELTAHQDVYARTAYRTILHGHPRFTVILSMDCPGLDAMVGVGGDICEAGRAGECHLRCPEQRLVCGVPIVPGEVGTGPFGLCHTLPPAVEEAGAGIVWGHGLFAAGETDFNAPLMRMLDVENQCRAQFLERASRAAS